MQAIRNATADRSRAAVLARNTLELASNCAVALGVLFLFDIAAGLGLGTPAGTAGAVSALALIAFGVGAIVLPPRLRRTRRLHASRSYSVHQLPAARPARPVLVPKSVA